MAHAPAWHNTERLIQRNRQAVDERLAQAVIGPIRSVGIVGAGLMGTSIAGACVGAGVHTALYDTDRTALEAAPARVAADLPAKGLPGDAPASPVMRLLNLAGDLADLAGCDLVLESVPEILAVKSQVFAQLEPLLADEAVLATNTSTLPIGRLGAGLVRPGRFCGIHFCHPVRHRPLVEITRGPRTETATIARALAFARSIGKMPIMVDDGPGFAVNRLLSPYLNGALDLLLAGAGIAEVDQAMTGFGMAMGPLRFMDEIGLDTAMQAGRVLRDAFPNRVLPSPLLVSLVKAGRLGRKSAAGFYAYPANLPPDAPGLPDPKADHLVANWRTQTRPFTSEQIVDRLLLPTVLEATRLLEEGRGPSAAEIDLAMIFGLGFPAARGGLLYWADTLGAGQILQRLEPWSYLGELAQPTALLLEAARRNVPLSSL